MFAHFARGLRNGNRRLRDRFCTRRVSAGRRAADLVDFRGKTPDIAGEKPPWGRLFDLQSQHNFRL